MPLTRTPLRYPGGKSQLAPFISRLLDFKPPSRNIYCEPFCGGAGVAMSMLMTSRCERVFLNDADPGIYSFWRAALTETDRLIGQMWDTPIDIPTWDHLRSVRRSKLEELGPEKYSFELGFATFYLNRTNRSGIVEGGCIGGRSQTGAYRMDCRFNKETLQRKLEQLKRLSDRVSVDCTDASEYLRHRLPEICAQHKVPEEELFIYLDPPYVGQGRNLYMNHMKTPEHVELRSILESSGLSRWVLSYDDCELIRDLYDGWDIREQPVRYTANNRRESTELFVFGPHFSDFKHGSRVSCTSSKGDMRSNPSSGVWGLTIAQIKRCWVYFRSFRVLAVESAKEIAERPGISARLYIAG